MLTFSCERTVCSTTIQLAISSTERKTLLQTKNSNHLSRLVSTLCHTDGDKMQLNISSLMYIIGYVRQLKHTGVLARSTSGTVSTHSRMTNKNLWIEHVFKGRFLNISFTGNKMKIKAKKKVSYQVIRGLNYLMCCFHHVKTFVNAPNGLMDSYTVGLISEVSYLRPNDHFCKILSTEISGEKVTHGSMRFRTHRRHILVRHPGLEKPNTIMCQLFLYRLFFFDRRKIIYLENKLHTSTSFAKTIAPENKECFLRERRRQYERKSTRTAYKKEALTFQTMLKVLKIKADL